MTPPTFAAISSVFTLGGLLGSLTSGPLTSRYGRLLCMRFTSLFFLVGSVIAYLATSAPALGVSRFLTGTAAGASTVIVPLYISEVVPAERRGFFGSWTQVGVNVGILGTQSLGYSVSEGGKGEWRWVFVVGVGIAIVQIVGLGGVVESPKWLGGVKGDVAKARRALQRIRGRSSGVEEEIASWGVTPTPTERQRLLDEEAEAPSLLQPVSPTRSKPTTLGFLQVLTDPLTRPAILAVVGIMFAQQLCGINSIIMYSVSLLKDLLPISSGILTILISIINLAATIASSPLPDRLGRKTCILLSIAGQGTSSLILALSIVFNYKLLSAFAVLFFVAFFAVGLGPVPFILASELVGPEAVGAAQSWALGANYVATFLVAYLFPIVNEELNRVLGGAGWVYFIFAGFAVAAGVFVTKRVPETRGKGWEEVWGRERRVD